MFHSRIGFFEYKEPDLKSKTTGPLPLLPMQPAC
jgi:hypothetical protein